MNLLIDSLNSVNDFTTSNATLQAVSFEDWNYNNISGQLQVTLNANGSIVKTLDTPLNVSEFKFLVFHLFDFTTQVDSDLTFTIYGDSTQVNFPLDRFLHQYYEFPNIFDEITGFGFSSTNGIAFIVQGLFAFNDNFPFDIREGIISYIRKTIDNDTFLQISLGQSTITQNSNSITILGTPKFVEKHVVVKFGNEIHQVEKLVTNPNSYTIFFNQNYSGRLTLNAYTDENVYLYYPVLNNPNDIENNDPAISVEDGFEPTRDLSKAWYVGNEEMFAKDSNSNLYYRNVLGRFIYKIVVLGICRDTQHKRNISRLFRKIQGFKKFYYNGKSHVFQGNEITNQDFENNTSVLRIELTVEIIEYEYQGVFNALNNIMVTSEPKEKV